MLLLHPRKDQEKSCPPPFHCYNSPLPPSSFLSLPHYSLQGYTPTQSTPQNFGTTENILILGIFHFFPTNCDVEGPDDWFLERISYARISHGRFFVRALYKIRNVLSLLMVAQEIYETGQDDSGCAPWFLHRGVPYPVIIVSIGNWTRWQWLRSMVLAPWCSISSDHVWEVWDVWGRRFLLTCSYWRAGRRGWSLTGQLVVDLCLVCVGFWFNWNLIFFSELSTCDLFQNSHRGVPCSNPSTLSCHYPITPRPDHSPCPVEGLQEAGNQFSPQLCSRLRGDR